MRAKTLRFTGTYTASGEPDRWFTGVPARDLDAAEVQGLSDEDYANITGGPSPLYVDGAPKAKAAASKPAATAKKATAAAKGPAANPAARVAPAQASPAGDGAVDAPPAAAP